MTGDAAWAQLEYGYVVVGGGTAGAVVAAGLSQVHCGNREVRSDEDLSALARAASHTVYHVSCTARMGAPAFPSLTTVNPVIAVLMLAERGAEIVARAARVA